MKEVDNVLKILKLAKRFMKEDNVSDLKNLSNQTIHTAAVSQDPDNIIVAVLVYSIGKAMERDHYREMEGWSEFVNAATSGIDNAVKSLEAGNIDDARLHLGEIRNSLNEMSGDLSHYIKDVFQKAEINKAFKLYEHGLSTEKTAELLGISLWDLASYIGQSSIADAKVARSMPIRERLKIAETLFDVKYLIFDAGPIISLTMNGMLHVLENLKKEFKGEFILTPRVKKEVVDRPMKIKKYKLEAMQVKDLIDRGIFKMSTEVIPQNKLDREVKRILKITNGVLRSSATGEKINIIHDGEAACLAFSSICGESNIIILDERTTRMLGESPENLESMMEKKLHMPLDSELSLLEELKKFKFIRSTELLFMAYRKGLIPIKGKKDLLDALLYGMKFKGTAISSDEIEDMKSLA